MLRRFFFSVFMSLLIALPAGAQDFPALHQVQGVARDDVLNIRTDPSARSQIIGALSPFERNVEIIGLSEDRNWGLLRHGEGVGWASMRYLTPMGGPAWHSGGASLECGGTEPFWTLRLFFPDNRAEYFAPSTSFELRTDAPHLAGTTFPQTLATSFRGAREGFLVIRQGLCSDGMSDQLFGLETQIYWRGQATGLSGCCSLAP